MGAWIRLLTVGRDTCTSTSHALLERCTCALLGLLKRIHSTLRIDENDVHNTHGLIYTGLQ